MHTLLNLWRTLEEIPDQSALSVVWRKYLGEDYETVRDAFLQRQPELARSFPCPRDCGCAHDVVRLAPDSIVAECCCTPPKCATFPLANDDIAAWDLSWSRLVRALCRAFGLDPKPDTLTFDGTAQVGSWSSHTVPVILTIQSEPDEFLLAVTQLVAALQQPFILLGPTADNLTATCQQYLNSAGAAFLPLETHVHLTEAGILLPTKTPGEIFARFNPQPNQAQDQNTMEKVRALLKAFDSTHLRKPPSLSTVYELYCVQGLSQGQIARKCNCSRSTVQNRLHLIRDRTHTHWDQLRAMSSHLENLEDQASDPRAKHIHRRRLIDDNNSEPE